MTSTTEQAEPSSPDELATEIRKAREAKGLSLADLHRLTGMSRNTLHQYESGARRPGAKELKRLCEVLEVSPNRLLFGSEQPFASSGGVLRSILKVSSSEPQRAVAISALVLPLAASILNSIGRETLEALATIADEAIRARDPETYDRLQDMISAFFDPETDTLKNLPPESRTAAFEALVSEKAAAREKP